MVFGISDTTLKNHPIEPLIFDNQKMAHFHRIVYYNRKRPCHWCKKNMALSVTCSACETRSCIECSMQPDEYHAMTAPRVVCKDCSSLLVRFEPLREIIKKCRGTQYSTSKKKKEYTRPLFKVPNEWMTEVKPLIMEPLAHVATPVAEPMAAERPASPAQLLFQSALFSAMEQVTSSPCSLDDVTCSMASPPATVHHTPPPAPHKRTKAKDYEVFFTERRLRFPKK